MPKNWQHTAILAATTLFAFVLFSPETFAAYPWLIQLAKFATAGGLAGLFGMAHSQATANAAAIQQVDEKVVDTHAAVNGRMDQLVVAAKAQGAQDQRIQDRSESHT